MDAVVTGVSADEGVVVDNDIAAAVADTFGIEAPTPAVVVETPAPGTPETPAEAAPTVPETPASKEGEGEVAATPAEQVAKLLDEANGEAMKLDPETVPEELRPFLKSFQADYTRKSQALATERKKSAEELASDEVADLRAKVEELSARPAAPVAPPTAAPAPPETPDLVAQITASVEREHGKMLTFEDAMADENPASLQRYIKQQGVFEARLAQAEMAAKFAPVVQETRQAVNANKQAEAEAEWQAVVTASPQAAEYEGEIAALLTVPDGNGGFRYTLQQAADLVLAQTSRDVDVQRAIAVGVQAGEQRAKQVAANKDNFAVPSAATAPKGGPTFTPTMSLDEIGLAAVQDL